MKLQIAGEMPNNSSTELLFYYDKDEKLLVDATYLEKDLPKSRVSVRIAVDKIVELHSAVDAVLCGTQKQAPITIPESKMILTVQRHETKSNHAAVWIVFRIESLDKGKFVQLVAEAKAFHSIRTALGILLQRLL